MDAVVIFRSPDAEGPAVRHRINRIQNQVAQSSAKLLGIAREHQLSLGQVDGRLDLRPSITAQLRVVEFYHAMHDLVQIYRFQPRRRHFGKVAKPPNDGFEVGQFGQ